MRRSLLAPLALALVLAGCSPAGPAVTTPASSAAPEATAAPSEASPARDVEQLTLADLDASGLAAAGFQANPDVGSESVALWQTSDCTVQVLVEGVRVTGDDRRDAEEAFGALPDTYTDLAPHRDVVLPLAAGGELPAPAMTAQLTHSDGAVTPALVAMRVVGERESLVSVTLRCSWKAFG